MKFFCSVFTFTLIEVKSWEISFFFFVDFNLVSYLGHLIVKFKSSKAADANKELPVLCVKRQLCLF